METIIAKEGVKKAVEVYAKMKTDTAFYYIDWISMDFLGNQLYNLKRYEEAKLIFENNATEFPERASVQLSLANTYLALGRKTDAMVYYKKTLVLDSGNEEAKNRLKELERQ
jgi:tetratricopeptide (TPR) repeat protein